VWGRWLAAWIGLLSVGGSASARVQVSALPYWEFDAQRLEEVWRGRVLSGDGRTVAGDSREGRLEFWSAADGVVGFDDPMWDGDEGGYGNRLYVVGFSDDGSVVAATSEARGRIILWERGLGFVENEDAFAGFDGGQLWGLSGDGNVALIWRAAGRTTRSPR
jgi:hypothetical protein